MVKLVFCLHRRADIDEAEFHRYWREVHGPLAASFAPVLSSSGWAPTPGPTPR